MVDVDTGVDSPGSVHCGSGDGVVVIAAESVHELFGGGDDAQFGVEEVHVASFLFPAASHEVDDKPDRGHA